jgi:[CysO sulfur-carrier protein]-S-L-cysteine hydrolase
MLNIVIPGRIVEELKAHAREASPNECCGLLSGRDSTVATRHALRNLSPTPERNYFASPEELFRAMRRIRSAEESLLAIYHSHPSGPAHPSDTDVAMAYYPDVIYLVISLVPEIEIRAFTIRERVVEAAELVMAEP